MGTLSSKLRIGEKIGLGFGIVALLFLGVIWLYHHSLQSAIQDYTSLYDVSHARQTYALEIEDAFAKTQRAEKDFLLHREERFVVEVETHLDYLLNATRALAKIDQESRQAAGEIQALANEYKDGFLSVADAWRAKGLDEDSGLQGRFRKKVHELQRLSGHFAVDGLYCQLLQIRRGEKDLALRNEALYRDRVNGLIDGFRSRVESSELRETEKQALLEEIGIYEEAFAPYADSVLADEDIHGGKGPFRQAAHRIEAILNAHQVRDLETFVLKLRRREKDYLLRHDIKYVDMVQQTARSIHERIAAASISFEDKQLLVGLLDDYERDFLSLVEQDAHIEKLIEEMNQAAERITPLVISNAEQANLIMATRVRKIAESSHESVRLNLIIAGGAALLGLFFAATITTGIVRPVRKMAGMLDELTHQIPAERIPTLPGNRDEINAMGKSLNSLMDHRARLLGWWKATMKEATAKNELEKAGTDNEVSIALEEIRSAVNARVQEINAIRGQLLKYVENIRDVARQLRARGSLSTNAAAEELDHSARDISLLLEVVSNDGT